MTYTVYNTNLQPIAHLSLETRRFKIEGSHPQWVAIASLYSKIIDCTLYEKEKEDATHTFYKRSSFLPEMVGQKKFLDTLKISLSSK